MDETRPTIGRALDILDLLTVETPSWTAEQICDARGLSVPTAYRYIRELLSAGLLAKISGSRYALGPRIIALDYTIRQSDPLLRAALPVMADLVRRTGCDCVLSSLLGDRILDTHRETGAEPLSLAYGRGRPRPMFKGAAPKVILGEQSASWLRKLYDAHAAEIASAGMGADFAIFRKELSGIKRRGFYVSQGELETALSAIAAPIRANAQDSQAAIALVTSAERFQVLNADLLAKLVTQAAEQIGLLLGSEAAIARLEATS